MTRTTAGARTGLTYDDLVAMPDDGMRHEVLDGVMHMTPSPRPVHQRVSGRLERILEDYFHPRGLGEVFHAPVDVLLSVHDIVVPDIVVVDTPAAVTGRAIEAPPLLVVEILSPSTARTDRTVKFARYGALGIRHYWIVDIDRQTIDCHRSTDRRYGLVARSSGDEPLRHPDWPDLLIETAGLWRGTPGL